MEQFLSVLVSSIIQVLLINIIPFFWWLIFHKKKVKYFDFIGLKSIKSKNKKSLFFLVLLITIIFGIIGIYILTLLSDVEKANSQFYGLGLAGLFAVIIHSFVQTSFSEEIFFRGFLLKRISSKFGFYAGNIVQSILFGLLHGLMFCNLTSIFNTILIILFTSFIAYFMGYLNEKKANGSIIPSFIIHGLSNLISGIISLFKLI